MFEWESGNKLLKSKFQAAERIDAKTFRQLLRRVSILVHSIRTAFSWQRIKDKGGTSEPGHVMGCQLWNTSDLDHVNYSSGARSETVAELPRRYS